MLRWNIDASHFGEREKGNGKGQKDLLV